MSTTPSGGRQQGKTFAALQQIGAAIAANGHDRPMTIGLSRSAWRALRAALSSEAVEWSLDMQQAVLAASNDATEFQAYGITIKILAEPDWKEGVKP